MAFRSLPASALLAAILFAVTPLLPAVEAEATAFSIAGGTLLLEPPEGFDRVRPASRMIESEFSIASADDLPPGRMTVMGAGGTIEANIDRWCGQFVQPEGGDTADAVTRKEMKVAGCDVVLVEIPGTYLDKPGGPFAGGPTIQRPDYRMLAAIVQTPKAGNYFLKFYGPAGTVEAHAAGFRTMIEGMVPASR